MSKKLTLSCLFFLLLFSSEAFADARKNNFKNHQKPSQYLALGGNYLSDQNSQEYKISGLYQYVGGRFINELDLLYNTRYSGANGQSLEQNRKLYDAEISSKILIGNSNNYFNYYNRSKYDEFSSYYYDLTNTVGWGRMFFGGALEADINIGYDEIKNFDSQIILNPNLKSSLWLTDRIKLVTRAFILQAQNSYSENLRTNLSYKITNDLSLELYHNYDRKRFFYKTTKIETIKNEVSRSLVVRIRYDF